MPIAKKVIAKVCGAEPGRKPVRDKRLDHESAGQGVHREQSAQPVDHGPGTIHRPAPGRHGLRRLRCLDCRRQPGGDQRAGQGHRHEHQEIAVI
jgi:hypothetical protein